MYSYKYIFFFLFISTFRSRFRQCTSVPPSVPSSLGICFDALHSPLPPFNVVDHLLIDSRAHFCAWFFQRVLLYGDDVCTCCTFVATRRRIVMCFATWRFRNITLPSNSIDYRDTRYCDALMAYTIWFWGFFSIIVDVGAYNMKCPLNVTLHILLRFRARRGLGMKTRNRRVEKQTSDQTIPIK